MVEGTGGYQAAEVVIVPPGEVVALASSSNGDHVSSKPLKSGFWSKNGSYPKKSPKMTFSPLIIWAKALFFFEQLFPVVARTWLRSKSGTSFLGPKFQFLTKKSDFCHTGILNQRFKRVFKRDRNQFSDNPKRHCNIGANSKCKCSKPS